MKKINRVCLLILLMAVTLLFAGCEILEQPFPIGTEADSGSLIDPEKTSPETEAPLTPEEEALVDLAAEALWSERSDLPDRECFHVDVSYGANGNTNIYVDFDLYIGSYRTWESYGVTINANRTVTSISGGHHNYRQYLKGATAERIAAAEAGLDRQIARYGDKHSGYYFTVDDEGYLCLTCEVIVDKAFGDHEHKFFTERICKPE